MLMPIDRKPQHNTKFRKKHNPVVIIQAYDGVSQLRHNQAARKSAPIRRSLISNWLFKLHPLGQLLLNNSPVKVKRRGKIAEVLTASEGRALPASLHHSLLE